MTIAPSAAATPRLPPMRAWQANACDYVYDKLIVDGAEHCYVTSPTGTGKSRFIHEISERLMVEGATIVMVGFGQIVAQIRESFVNFDYKPLTKRVDCNTFVSPTGRLVIIDSWQALAAKSHNPYGPIALLIFDECQIGGTMSGTSHEKIKTIFKPKHRINVSATIQSVDWTICGKKAGHVFQHTLEEAYEARLLHPVDLVEVHAGVTIRAKLETHLTIRTIEAATGRSIDDLEELSDKELSSLAERCQKRGIRFDQSSLRELIRARHEAMIQIYMAQHAGEQAIFFSPRIEHAEEAARRFNALARRLRSDALRQGQDGNRFNVRAQCVHSNQANSLETIQRFVTGEIVVLFVVGMLQEGFDKWDLRLAFDCRFHRTWNPSRVARFIQKVGRLMRIPPSSRLHKKKSLYYYARSLDDFYDAPLDAGAARTNLVEPNVPEITDGIDWDEVEEEAEAEEAPAAPPAAESAAPAPMTPAEMQASQAAAYVRAIAEGHGSDDGIDRSDTQIDLARSITQTILAPSFSGVPLDENQAVAADPATDGADSEIEEDDLSEALDMTPLTVEPIQVIHTPLYVLRQARDHQIVARRSFVSLFGTAGERKREEIRRMAEAGEPRPKTTHPLGVHLNIQRALNTPWFQKLAADFPDFARCQGDRAMQVREYLEDLASKGKPFPPAKSHAAKFFMSQRAARSEWYVAFAAKYPAFCTSSRDNAGLKQRECERMAVNGEVCPPRGTPLGDYYHDAKATNTEWVQAFRERHPQFENNQITETLRKKLAIEAIAEAGETCPNYYTVLGKFFYNQKARKTRWFANFVIRFPNFSNDRVTRTQALRQALERYARSGAETLTKDLKRFLTHQKATRAKQEDGRRFYEAFVERYPRFALISAADKRTANRHACEELAARGGRQPPREHPLGNFFMLQGRANTPWYQDFKARYPHFEVTLAEETRHKRRAVEALAKRGLPLINDETKLRPFLRRERKARTRWYQNFVRRFPTYGEVRAHRSARR